jgi:hypothetical protein
MIGDDVTGAKEILDENITYDHGARNGLKQE